VSIVGWSDRRMVGWVLCIALSGYPALQLSAQTDSRLQAAVQLAQNGRADSARAIVRRLLATLSPQDSVYPQALYVQGVLAPDPQAAATSLQRVVVEYGTSPWADDALLRLAHLYFAQSDPGAAVQAVERLRLDYPDSPLKPRADFVGAQAYFNLRDEAHGWSLVQEALANASGDVEFKNQVSFYSSRCGATGVATTATQPPAQTPSSTATTGTRPGTTTATTTPPAGAGPFAVQVLAVKSATQVDEMLTRLKVMGFQTHVVRDSVGFLKVRVGRYATREEAQSVQRRLKSRIGGQPFIVEEP